MQVGMHSGTRLLAMAGHLSSVRAMQVVAALQAPPPPRAQKCQGGYQCLVVLLPLNASTSSSRLPMAGMLLLQAA